MGQNGEKKKRHTGLKVLLTLILLLAAAAAGLAIYFYPAYRAAGYLAESLNRQKLAFTLEVRLDRGELDAKKRLLLDTMAEITGLSSGDLCHLTLRGSVDGDIIYACVYPRGCEEPLTELYLSDRSDVVNGAMLYGAMRENFCGQNALLDYLFPVWEDHKFMSLKQAEDMFGVDLGAIRDFSLPLGDQGLSRLECFGILALMHREKGDSGEGFSVRIEGLDAVVWPREQTVCSISMEDPAEVLDSLGEKLSTFGINVDGDKLRMLDSLVLTAKVQEDVSLQMPGDLVSQGMVDIVKGIRAVLKGLSGR